MKLTESDSRTRPLVYLGLAAGSFILAHYSPLAVISAFGFEGLAAWRIIRHIRSQNKDTMEIVLPSRFKKLPVQRTNVVDLMPADEARTIYSLPQPKETHSIEK